MMYITLESEDGSFRIRVPFDLRAELAARKAQQQYEEEEEYDPTAERLKAMTRRNDTP